MHEIPLDAVSRVGFGCYRVEAGDPEHAAALVRALSLGCTLIDTANNYGDGRSEELIGQVLHARPEYPAFIVTKAGYITPAVEAALRAAGTPLTGLRPLSAESAYSLAPDILRAQMAISAKRLRRDRLDALLLHNPEHAFGAADAAMPDGHDDRRLRDAFAFLEECVAAGTLRYYGVSSNTLAGAADHRPISLGRLLAAARAVASDHHFRLVEFPFNLIETDAAARRAGGASLIEEIRASGLVSIANRPLNARRGDEIVRLATYGEAMSDPEEAATIYRRCVAHIADRLAVAYPAHGVMDFTIMRFLRDNWLGIEHPDTVDAIFRRHFYPFVASLWEGEIPRDVRGTCAALHRHARRHAQRRLSERGGRIRAELVRAGTIPESDTRPLATIACDYCLQSGVDHVVVGMRTPAYVESLAGLLRGAGGHARPAEAVPAA
jgi:aryl-alcohol dehydrogenase-like predicted oxidoreductase